MTGGAGFIGSHLVDRLIRDGHEVVALDNLVTGKRGNLAEASATGRLRTIEHDVCRPFPEIGATDAVFHLASPASPVDYHRHPIETLRTGSLGTEQALEAARRQDVPLLFTSTSEVYGDPEVHPQAEDYRGRVDPVGPRSVYDESKRYAEALTMAYHRTYGLPVRIARIFNTYGPRMRIDDGRVVPTFLARALKRRPLPVFGDGSQTRSFCFVADLVEGLIRLMRSGVTGPMNLGNPEEFTVLRLAQLVNGWFDNPTGIEFHPRPVDDPRQRRPDITKATSALGWRPTVGLEAGLRRMAASYLEQKETPA